MASATQTRQPTKRWILVLFAVLAAIAAVVWAVHWWQVGRFIQSTDDAYLKADGVSVAPKISGYVTQVFVHDNQIVHAGDPLVQLDTRQYTTSLAQQHATVDARQADIQQAQAQLAQQRAKFAQAQAQVQIAQVNLSHADAELARYAPLAQTGADSHQHVADLTNTRDQDRATLKARLADVDAARTQIAATEAQISQAKAQFDAAQRAAAQANLDVDNTIIRASVDGRIGDRTVRVGQYVQPGTGMMTVVPVQDLYLVANFKETQVGRMRPGQPVELHVDALPDRTLRGHVDSFAPGTGAVFALLPPENATGNFTKIVQRVPVRIRVEATADDRQVLLPGMSVTADVDTRDEHPRG